jgi:ABC-type transport system involved in multi-copper enzyme maturation permease subunit
VISFDANAFRLLSSEAIRDAFRRRTVAVVAVVCLLTLLMMESCSGCQAQIQLEGEAAKALDILSWAGVTAWCVLALWVITLAGLLSADQLSQAIDDGSAQLVLARPVSRDTFALSRLAGALAVALAAGLVLLGGATFFVGVRNALPLAPALVAFGACALSCVSIGAIAMTVSLHLPRMATVMLIFLAIASISSVNLFSVAGGGVDGFYGVVDRFGPPLASSVLLALAPWAGQPLDHVDAVSVIIRLIVWALGGIGLLVWSFRSREGA